MDFTAVTNGFAGSHVLLHVHLESQKQDEEETVTATPVTDGFRRKGCRYGHTTADERLYMYPETCGREAKGTGEGEMEERPFKKGPQLRNDRFSIVNAPLSSLLRVHEARMPRVKQMYGLA